MSGNRLLNIQWVVFQLYSGWEQVQQSLKIVLNILYDVCFIRIFIKAVGQIMLYDWLIEKRKKKSQIQETWFNPAGTWTVNQWSLTQFSFLCWSKFQVADTTLYNCVYMN